MDEGKFIPIKDVAEDISLRLLNAADSVQSGGIFSIDIEIFNNGPRIFSWEVDNPINISYRWFDNETNIVLVIDGNRASLEEFLLPYSSRIIKLLVSAPIFCGMAMLRVSCVCEGRFWFYEQFATGWADLGIKIVDPCSWPVELKGSVASRALQGSVAASALRTRLAAAPIHCLAPLSIEESAPEPVAPPVNEKSQDGLKFSPAPVEQLSAGPLDASSPAAWPNPDSVVTLAEVGGWRSWLRHPLATLGRYLNQALARSSLGQRLEASQRTAEELLERVRQVAENELHTQFMLRQMASYSERRDAFYAQNHHTHLDLLQKELSSFFHAKVEALEKVVADGFQANEAARLQFFEQQQALRNMLQSLIDSSRRLQLGQLRSEEDIKHMQDWQTGMTTQVEAVGQRQLEMREAVLLSASETSKALQSRFDDYEMAFDQAVAQLAPFKDDVLASIHEARQASGEQIRAAVIDLETGGNRYAENLEHLTRDIVDVRDILHTNLSYMFAKVDALLHRQVFPAVGSGKIICRNAKGLFAIPERDLDALAYYTAGQLPEAGSLAVVERLLKPGDTFVDVGANVGLFSVTAGRRVGNMGNVLSFEPAPETMSALAATIQLNGLGRIVSLHQSAAGRAAGTATLHIGQTCGHSSLLPLEESRETIEVPTVILDEVIGSQKVDLIKIDVEGWEIEVLQGLKKTLANNPQASVLLEFGPSHLQRAGMSVSTWISTLRAFEMNLFEIDEDSGSLTPLRSEGLEDIVSMNLLLSRKPEIGEG